MEAVGNNWYNLQAMRKYPIDGTATGLGDDGRFLPTDVLLDCNLRFPDSLGSYAYVTGITVSDRLITITFAATNAPILGVNATILSESTPNFVPLAAVTIQKPVSEGRHYAVTPLQEGVGGWVVVGPGLQNVAARCSSAKQSILLPRCARSYRALPVTGLRKQFLASKLTDVVTLAAGNDLEIVAETREIDNVERSVLVFRLKDTIDKNVFDTYRGPCDTRPESGTCDRTPLRKINTVVPNCDGDITLNFIGVDAKPYASGTGGITLATQFGLADTCIQERRLPDENGRLPNEYNGSCDGSLYSESLSEEIPSSYSPDDPPQGSSSISESVSVPPDPPESSISDPGTSSSVSEPPTGGDGCVALIEFSNSSVVYAETFDNGYAEGFNKIQGDFSVVNTGDFTGEPVDTWYPGQMSSRMYKSTNQAVRGLSVWTCEKFGGYPNPKYANRVVSAAVRLPGGGNNHAGVVLGMYYGGNGAYQIYTYGSIDYNRNEIRLDMWDSSGLRPIAKVSGVGLALNEWYVLELYQWRFDTTDTTPPNPYPTWVQSLIPGPLYSTGRVMLSLKVSLPTPNKPYNAISPVYLQAPSWPYYWSSVQYHGVSSYLSQAEFGYFKVQHSDSYTDIVPP